MTHEIKNDKLTVTALDGGRWEFYETIGGCLGIHGYKPRNDSIHPDVHNGWGSADTKALRDFLVKTLGPPAGYVKEGAEPEPLKYQVGDKVVLTASAPHHDFRERHGVKYVTVTRNDGGYGFQYWVEWGDGLKKMVVAVSADEIVGLYQEPTVADALAEYPEGTIIKFDADYSARYIRTEDDWADFTHGRVGPSQALAWINEDPAAKWPFAIKYDPRED